MSVVLIDLENCPNQIEKLQDYLEKYSRVVICYAQTGVKIPLDLLVLLSKAFSSRRLRVIKMESVGKNAADFGISFFAGALSKQLPKHTHFVIVSSDTDLDHVISLIKRQGRSAERLETAKEDADATPKKPLESTPNHALLPKWDPGTDTTKKNGLEATLRLLMKKYCIHLVTCSKSRPAKKDTLRNRR